MQSDVAFSGTQLICGSMLTAIQCNVSALVATVT